MKTINFLLILLLTCRICNGQNLIPNGDFEQYSGCPSYYGQIDSALFWINPNAGTPDYFHECSTFFNTGVPHNGMGDQGAHSGVAYGGISLFGVQSREYIETPLTSPLIANTQYHFEMYANIGNRAQYTTDALQVYFSDTLIANVNSTSVLPFTPQVSNTPGVFLNDVNWTLISGDYTAHGGESYLVIGNFKNDASTAVQNNGGPFNTAFAYIEDVSLTTIITGINGQTGIVGVNLFPNPFNDKLNVSINTNGLAEIILYDIASRKMLQQKFTNSVSLNTEQLANGIYIYELQNKNETIEKGKVFKQ